jgi:CHASE3 domain sensor protein
MSGEPDNLQKALNAYKTNYAAYKVSGNSAFKTAYENALNNANQIIQSSAKIAEDNERYIQNFLDSYESTNEDIVSLHKKSKDIQTQGPKLQDDLAQSRQLHAHEVAAINDTYLYIKAGVVVGLLIIVGIAGVW